MPRFPRILLCSVGLLAFAVLAPGGARADRFDRDDKASVIAFYRRAYLGSAGRSHRFTGSVERCNPGTISGDYRRAGLERIGYYRAMAGLNDDLDESKSWSAKCQAAALMFSANRAISHDPPRSWKCWTPGGDEAAGKSNIAWGQRSLSDAVDDWMEDRSTSAVGHRRWILYPPLEKVGLGAVPAGRSTGYAMWCVGLGGDRPSGPEWVAWPSPGWFPAPLVPRYWSFSIPGASFARASVRMTVDGDGVSVSKQPVKDGFGDNTLVWTARGGMPTRESGRDTRIKVTVSGVRVGRKTRTFEYDVQLIRASDL